jgi:predicted dehydrogenase
MKTVSVGIVGSGFAANIHVEALRRVYGVTLRIAAVASDRPEHARAFADRHGIPVIYPRYLDLIEDPSIDVICICVPNDMHGEIAVSAANNGKHIICEKPLTGAFAGRNGLTGVHRARAELDQAMASAAGILSAVEQNGVLFMYAENWVYTPSMMKAKKLLKTSGGSILDIRAEQSHSGSHAPRSRRRETAGGGALLMLGSHPIAAALHLKNYEGLLAEGRPIQVTSVTAEVGRFYDCPAIRRTRSRNWLVEDWEDVETWANVVLNFTDGTKALVTASFAMLGGIRNSFEIYTTNSVYRSTMSPAGGLQAFAPDPDAFGHEPLHEKAETRAGWSSDSSDDWISGYPQEMQDFMEAVAYKRPPVSDLSLACDVLEVIYTSYLSAEEGRRIDLQTRPRAAHVDRKTESQPIEGSLNDLRV